MENDFQKRIEAALRDPKNLGEMESADAIGTAGSAGCGDMIRLWIKFKEQNGKKVIERATFQSFGCETAIAVASLATEIIRGKTPEEVLAMPASDLAPGLGPFPPVRIHCTELVESALRSALLQAPPPEAAAPEANASNLLGNFTQPSQRSGKVKIVLLDEGRE
jgi:nitrogen fixation NifU-like protein